MAWFSKIDPIDFNDSAERGVKALHKAGRMTDREARDTLDHIAEQRAKGTDPGVWRGKH
jgi:hypothetical protein